MKPSTIAIRRRLALAVLAPGLAAIVLGVSSGCAGSTTGPDQPRRTATTVPAPKGGTATTKAKAPEKSQRPLATFSPQENRLNTLLRKQGFEIIDHVTGDDAHGYTVGIKLEQCNGPVPYRVNTTDPNRPGIMSPNRDYPQSFDSPPRRAQVRLYWLCGPDPNDYLR